MKYSDDLLYKAELRAEDEICSQCIVDDYDKDCSSCEDFLSYRDMILEELSLETW
jgi:hypothetical protein